MSRTDEKQKKKMSEKKMCVGETRMGSCLFSFCAGSRYSKLYHDTAGLGVQQGDHDTVGSPATRPAYARGERQRARM